MELAICQAHQLPCILTASWDLDGAQLIITSSRWRHCPLPTPRRSQVALRLYDMMIWKLFINVRGCGDSHPPHLQSRGMTKSHNPQVTDRTWLESGPWIPTSVLFAAPIIDLSSSIPLLLYSLGHSKWCQGQGATCLVSTESHMPMEGQGLTFPDMSYYQPTLVSRTISCSQNRSWAFPSLRLVYSVTSTWYIHPPSTPIIPIIIPSIYWTFIMCQAQY